MTARQPAQQSRELDDLDDLTIEVDETENPNIAAVVLEMCADWQRKRYIEAGREPKQRIVDAAIDATREIERELEAEDER